MEASNYMVRATALEGKVRAFALRATDVVDELQRRHGTYPAVTAALGRTAMGALLMAAASLKKEDQVLTVEVKGGGPVGRVVSTANGRGEVRGLVSHPKVHADSVLPGKLNVAGVVGTTGYLSVTKDLGMRDAYQGTVELQSGEIGDDIAFYLARSEQTPSAVGIGVFVRADEGSPAGQDEADELQLVVEAAGGFLIQLLPGLEDEEIVEIERQIAALPHPTTLIREGLTPEQVLERIFGGDVQILDRYPVSFACPCSRERFESAIITLGRDEIERLIEEEDKPSTEVVCHFCNEAYQFSPDDMRDLLRAAG